MEIPIHKDCSHTDLIEKCKECVWSDCSDDYTFYMADGTGTSILILRTKKTVLPWTLSKASIVRKKKSGVPNHFDLFMITYYLDVCNADSTSEGETDGDIVTDGSNDIPVSGQSIFVYNYFYLSGCHGYAREFYLQMQHKQGCHTYDHNFKLYRSYNKNQTSHKTEAILLSVGTFFKWS